MTNESSESSESSDLRLQNESLRQSEKQLIRELTTERTKLLFYQKLEQQKQTLLSRWGFIQCFLRYSCTRSAFDGKLYREWNEYMTLTPSSDLSLYVPSSTFSVYYEIDPSFDQQKRMIERHFFQQIHQLELLISYSNGKNDKSFLPVFGNYFLTKIEHSNLFPAQPQVIPSVICHFSRQHTMEPDHFYLRFKAWNDMQDVPNITADCAWIYKDEIRSCCEHININQITHHIIQKEIHYTKDIELLQKCAFPTQSIARALKITYLNKLYEMILETLPLLDKHYTFVGKHPKIYISKEECVITGSSPNFPTLQLKCHHVISMMAYKGLLNNQNQFSESIRCPFCRADCIIEIHLSPSNPYLHSLNIYMKEMDSIPHVPIVDHSFVLSKSIISEDASRMI